MFKLLITYLHSKRDNIFSQNYRYYRYRVFMSVLIFCFANLTASYANFDSQAFAQTTNDPNSLFLKGYNLCAEGERLIENGSYRAAHEKFEDAIKILNALTKRYPNWHRDVIKRRRKIILNNLSKINASSPTQNIGNSAYTAKDINSPSTTQQAENTATTQAAVNAREATIDQALQHIQLLNKKKQDEISNLRKENNSLVTQFEQAKKNLEFAINEAQQTKKVVNDLEQQIGTLKANVMSERKLRMEQVSELKEESTTKLLKYEETVNNLKKQHNQSLSDIEIKMKLAEEKFRSQLSELKEGQQEKIEQAVADKTREIEELRIQFQEESAKLIEENNKIVKKLQSAHQSTIASLKTENSTLAERLEKLSSLIANAKEVKKIIASRDEKIELLTTERDRLKKALNQAYTANDASIMNENIKLRHRLDKARLEIKDLETKQKQLLIDKKELTAKVSQLENQNQELIAEKDKLNSENIDLRQLNKSLEVAKSSLENERDSWKKQAVGLQNELAETRRNLAKIERDNLQHLNTISKIERELTLKNQELKELAKNNSADSATLEIKLLQNIIRRQLKKHMVRKTKYEQLLDAISERKLNLNEAETKFAMLLKESDIQLQNFQKEASMHDPFLAQNLPENAHAKFTVTAKSKNFEELNISQNLQEEEKDTTPNIGSKEAKVSNLNNKAISFMRQGQINEAKNYLEKSLNIEPNNWQAQMLLGRAHLEHRNKNGFDIQEAINHLKQASITSKGEKEPDVFYMLGLAYFKNRNYDKASLCFNQAVELNPKYANALYFKALIEKENNELQKAINLLEELLGILPTHRDAHAQLAFLYAIIPANEGAVAKKNLEKAKFHYQKSLQLDAPPNPFIESLLGINNNSKTAKSN